MAEIKVTYFDIEGAAEKIRLAFALCNRDFEDIRINHAEWGALKSTMPYGQLPVVEFTDTDGSTNTFAQSPAIMKWIARSYDNNGSLYPHDVEEAVKVDEMIGLSNDLAKTFQPSIYLGFDHTKFGYPAEWSEKEETIKKVQEAFLTNDLPRFMKYLTDAIEKNGSKFFTGSNLTIADLHILPQIRALASGWARHIPTDCLAAYPTITAWMERMYAVPQIRRWYKIDHERLSIKITYFNIAGAAEKVRLALAMCGKEFHDDRINFQDWPALKPTMPYGQLPVMNVTNEKTGETQLFTQSPAMLRWIVQKFDKTGKLLPRDTKKLMKVEEMIGLSDDLAKAWAPCLYVGMRHEMFGHPQEWPEKEEVVKGLREKFLANDLPRFMKYFTSALSGGVFFAGDHVTIADIQILPQLKYFTQGIADHVPADCLDGYPVVTDWMERMFQIPQIKKWYNL